MKILLAFHGLLPRRDIPATGSGVRAEAIARALRERGHHVILASQSQSLERYGLPLSQAAAESGFDFYFFESKEDFNSLLSTVSPEVIIVQQWETLNFIENDSDIPIAVDLYAPRPIEDQFSGIDLGFKLVDYLSMLNKADFFFCAGERQRHFYLGWLMFAGVNMQRIPIQVVPLAINPDLPKPPPRDYSPEKISFITAGYHWRWQNLFGPLKSLLSILEERGQGVLEMYRGKYILSKEGEAEEEAPSYLAGQSRVKMNPVVPLGELEEALKKAHIAFDLFAPNSERILATPFRTLMYLANGLPIITGKDTEMAAAIREAEAGFTVDPHDEYELGEIVKEIFSSPDRMAKMSQNAFELARTRYNWERAIDPLDEFVCRPKKRERKYPTFLELFTESIINQNRVFDTTLKKLEEDVIYWRDRVGVLEREKLQDRNAFEWEKARMVAEAIREKNARDVEMERRISEKQGEVGELTKTLAQKDKYIDDLRARIDGHIKEITALEHRLAQSGLEYEREIAGLKEELSEKKAYLDMILNSRPYKLFKIIKGG